MILTAHQVGYLPWLGFFHKVAMAEQFVSFDAVQFERKSFTNRNYIKTANGPILLTVPTRSTGSLDLPLCDVEIAEGNWARKHLRSIQLAYCRAPYFEQHFAGIGAIIDLYSMGGMLMDLNLDMLRYFLRAFGLQRNVVRASDYRFEGQKSALVLDMCLKLGATKYIFGGQGKEYADVDAFRKAGVEPVFQEFVHPVYAQQGEGFVSNMAALDLLMNAGPKSMEVITGGSP